MVSDVIPFRRASSKRDWTNEELAELYRVEHALIQARVALETDRGVTDEGDPWFVFCRPEGDVLVHIARMDGEYHLFSPALPHALSGSSFSALTQSFVDTIPVPAPMRQDRGARIVMHPAAMLSILVVTIFFSADIITGHTAQASELSAPEDASHEEANDLLIDGQSLEISKAPLKYVFLKTVSALAEAGSAPGVVQNSTYLTLVAAVAGFTATLNGSEFVTRAAPDEDVSATEHRAADHDGGSASQAALAGNRGEPVRYHPSEASSDIESGISNKLQAYTPNEAWSTQAHAPDEAAAHKIDVKIFEVASLDDAFNTKLSDHSDAQKKALPKPPSPADLAGLPLGEHRPVHAALPAPESNENHNETKADTGPVEAPPLNSEGGGNAGASFAAVASNLAKAADVGLLPSVSEKEALPAQPASEVAEAPAPEPASPAESIPSPEEISATVDTLVASVKSQVVRGAVDYNDLLTFISSDPKDGSKVSSEMLSWNDKTVFWNFTQAGGSGAAIKQFDTDAKLMVDAFLKSTPDAEFLIKGHCILIAEDPDLSNIVYGAFQSWALDDGTVIALVGHIDQPAAPPL